MNKKKFNLLTLIYGLCSLVVVVLFLCLPLLHVDTFKDFNVNGFQILKGSYIKKSALATTIVILRTSSFNFCAVLFPIGVFLFYHIVSSAPVKRLSALLCAMAGFVYIVFIPVLANYWRNRTYDPSMDVTKIWGWYVVVGIYFAYIIFILVDFIITLKKEKKKLSED